VKRRAGQQLGWPSCDATGALGGGQLTATAAVLAGACAAARCVSGCIMAAGPLDAMLWKQTGLQIGLSQGQGSTMR
jgi:hypothetical protein